MRFLLKLYDHVNLVSKTKQHLVIPNLGMLAGQNGGVSKRYLIVLCDYENVM